MGRDVPTTSAASWWSLLRRDQNYSVNTISTVYRQFVGRLQHFYLCDVFPLEPVDAAVARQRHSLAIDHIQWLAGAHKATVNLDGEATLFHQNQIDAGKAMDGLNAANLVEQGTFRASRGVAVRRNR